MRAVDEVFASMEALSPQHPDVYPAQPDSRFLMQTVTNLLGELQSRQPVVAIEVGCGAAPCATLLSVLLPSVAVFATDISWTAVHAAQAVSSRHSARVHLSRGNLLSAFRDGMVDLVCFLPPYVPTSADALREAIGTAAASDGTLEACLGSKRPYELAPWTWAGGPSGTALLEAFVREDLVRVLAPRGIALILVGLLDQPERVVALIDEATGGALVTSVAAAGGDQHTESWFVFRVERRARP